MENKQTSPCRKRRASDNVPCSVTIPAALQQSLIRISLAEDRSFSATVRKAVEAYVASATSTQGRDGCGKV